MFSDRDNFIVASTILVTSSIAKKIPRDVRMSILKLLRDTKYTSITDAEWHEIAQGINNHKKDVTGIMMKGLGQAMFGGGFGEYSDKMKRFEIGRLPVVSRFNDKRIMGIITPEDIVNYLGLSKDSQEEGEDL